MKTNAWQKKQASLFNLTLKLVQEKKTQLISFPLEEDDDAFTFIIIHRVLGFEVPRTFHFQRAVIVDFWVTSFGNTFW